MACRVEALVLAISETLAVPEADKMVPLKISLNRISIPLFLIFPKLRQKKKLLRIPKLLLRNPQLQITLKPLKSQ